MIDAILQNYGLIDAAVFGRIWRYCQMKDGVCTASIETIAFELGLHRNTVRKAVHRLTEHGFLIDMDPGCLWRPHRYKDTGKAAIYGKFEAVVNEVEGRGLPATSDEVGRALDATSDEEGRVFNATGRAFNATEVAVKARQRESLRESFKDTENSETKNSVTSEDRKIWRGILETLQQEMPKSVYDLHLRGSSVLERREDGTWIVQVKAMSAEWLESRMVSTIRRALVGYTGQDSEVQFVERSGI